MKIITHIKCWNRWRKLGWVGISKKDKFLNLIGVKEHPTLNFIKLLDKFTKTYMKNIKEDTKHETSK